MLKKKKEKTEFEKIIFSLKKLVMAFIIVIIGFYSYYSLRMPHDGFIYSFKYSSEFTPYGTISTLVIIYALALLAFFCMHLDEVVVTNLFFTGLFTIFFICFYVFLFGDIIFENHSIAGNLYTPDLIHIVIGASQFIGFIFIALSFVLRQLGYSECE